MKLAFDSVLSCKFINVPVLVKVVIGEPNYCVTNFISCQTKFAFKENSAPKKAGFKQKAIEFAPTKMAITIAFVEKIVVIGTAKFIIVVSCRLVSNHLTAV